MSNEKKIVIDYGDVNNTTSLGSIVVEFNAHVSRNRMHRKIADYSSEVDEQLAHIVTSKYPEADGIKNVLIQNVSSSRSGQTNTARLFVTGNAFKNNSGMA